MNLLEKIKNSSFKLKLGTLFVLVILYIVLFIGCLNISKINFLGPKQEINTINYKAKICIDDVFEKYKKRWNKECENLPNGLKEDPSLRDIQYGFACGLPSSISTALNLEKTELESECINKT